MGADGHIELYDYDKLIRDKDLGDKEDIAFRNIIKDSACYYQDFQGRTIITDYHGDNLYCRSLLYEIATSGWVKGNWHDSFYFDAAEKDCEKYKISKDRISELCDYLVKHCYIASWEIWT